MSGKSKKTLVFTDTDNGGIIHVANIKGGVGKSTVATNLAASLARRGPTLLIDLDVQGSATHALGKNPSEFTQSSWLLFSKRFAGYESGTKKSGYWGKITEKLKLLESKILPQIVGKGDITSITVQIQPCLDLIPANADLFKTVTSFHISNLLYNLQLCRQYYKYIVLDTPSVWNKLETKLFFHSDINLVPVTLNALSTRSLRDYLLNVKRLAQKHPRVRLRIVKNEVFGKQTSKIKGKTRTMSENRRFLEGLCEQSIIKNESGVSLLPQSILFDLEIPESAIVRDAQDEGKSVHEFHQYSSVTKAFDELAQNVQYVLNRPISTSNNIFMEKYGKYVEYAYNIITVLIFVLILGKTPAVVHPLVSRPIAPQQLIESDENVFVHTFKSGESMFRIAKYAICYFRAVVPSMSDLDKYVMEVIRIHNLTRQNGEDRISDPNNIPSGLKVSFYPPSQIHNPREKELLPVYRYFNSFTDDKLAYITGDWCERGTGGGTPHYGIDVASALGSKIISPIDGIAVVRNIHNGGRTLGVVKNGMVIFFAHMDERYFKTGDIVKKGDTVGTVGMTGRTNGPHVHVGYGVLVPGNDGLLLGRHRYKVTDPKLFFYREHYMDEMN